MRMAGAMEKTRDPGINASTETLPAAQLSANGSTLAVHVPMTFRKRGGRKMVISPAGTPVSQTHWAPQRSSVDDSLVRSLAQAFQWQRMLDEGQFATIGDLAEARKLDRSFVSRMLRLTLLSPDIVEGILDGRQSSDLHRQKLLHGFPSEWDKQEMAAGPAIDD